MCSCGMEFNSGKSSFFSEVESLKPSWNDNTNYLWNLEVQVLIHWESITCM